MKNRRIRIRKNINKNKTDTDKNFTLEQVLKADLSNEGIIFMLFILILLIGSIFFDEKVLWIMAVVLFVEMISKRNQ